MPVLSEVKETLETVDASEPALSHTASIFPSHNVEVRIKKAHFTDEAIED